MHWAASQLAGGFELPFICWRAFQEPIKPYQREGDRKREKRKLIPWNSSAVFNCRLPHICKGGCSEGAGQAGQGPWARQRFKLKRRPGWPGCEAQAAGWRAGAWHEPVSRSMLLPINHLVQPWVSAVGLTREPGSNKTLTDWKWDSLLPVSLLPFEMWGKGWERTKRHWWLITT